MHTYIIWGYFVSELTEKPSGVASKIHLKVAYVYSIEGTYNFITYYIVLLALRAINMVRSIPNLGS